MNNWNKPIEFPEWKPPSMEELFGLNKPSRERQEIDSNTRERVTRLIQELKNKKKQLDGRYKEDLETIKQEIHNEIDKIINE